MIEWQTYVRQFHIAFEQPAPVSLRALTPEEIGLRKSLILEETQETVNALDQLALMPRDKYDEHVAGVADGLSDLIYVVLGTAVQMGLDLEPFFNEVQRSNMSKVWPDGLVHKREDGKVLKSPTWHPPKLLELVRKLYPTELSQIMRGEKDEPSKSKPAPTPGENSDTK